MASSFSSVRGTSATAWDTPETDGGKDDSNTAIRGISVRHFTVKKQENNVIYSTATVKKFPIKVKNNNNKNIYKYRAEISMWQKHFANNGCSKHCI